MNEKINILSSHPPALAKHTTSNPRMPPNSFKGGKARAYELDPTTNVNGMKFKVKNSIEEMSIKKLLLLCIIVGIIIISGCVGEEKTKSGTPINQEKIESSETGTDNQSNHLSSSEQIFKTEWYKIGESQQFDIGNDNIVEVKCNHEDYSGLFYVGAVSKNLKTDSLNVFIRFKDDSDNVLFGGQPHQKIIKNAGMSTGHFGTPDDAAYWQIEIHLVPVVPMTPTPTKTPIKLK